MLGNLVNLLIWLLLAVWIVVCGWDEPLRYRFISQEARDAEEKVLIPTPPPSTPAPPDYRKWGTPKKGPGALGNSPLGGHGTAATPYH